MIEKINSPADLKDIPVEQLPALAEEIRQLIISTVDNNGGHMASNLGVVELTIALHRVFNSPVDRIIFDISHQSYAHKILTGRANRFASIRTTGGYSGYFDYQESMHDLFTLGHAGVGPSLALGFATAEKMKGADSYVVCVIGDGGLGSGPAYEGLSNIIAQNPRNLMVILNDNGMSINPNVGWLASWRKNWLPRLRGDLEMDNDFQKFEDVTERLAPKVPFGDMLLDLGRGMKSAIQKSLIPGIGQVWDEMGFNYIGPIDGHDIDKLISVIDKARRQSDKVPFIHVLTNKGQGYEPSLHDPVHYHQSGPADAAKPQATYSQVFAQCLGELMTENERIVAISAAMLEGTGLAALQKTFPGRVFDVGICEQHAVSMAAGMARGGLRPVVCIYSTFLQRAFDEILHDVCMNDLPVVFAIDRAGLVGQDGKTHHGLFDLAYMRLAPNMVVTVPCGAGDLYTLLYTAVHQSHPFSIRYPRGPVFMPIDYRSGGLLPIPTSQWLVKGGSVCLVAVGEQVNVCLNALKTLYNDGITCGLINLQFVKPLDPELINELQGYESVLVIEEGTGIGGVTSAILEEMNRQWPALRGSSPDDLPPLVYSMSLGDCFPDHGEIDELRHDYGLDAEAIISRVKNIVYGGK